MAIYYPPPYPQLPPKSAATAAYSPPPPDDLVAEPGTLTLTGQTVNLSLGSTLTANEGTLTLTGEQATLNYGYSLTANPGTLTLTGQSATLRFGRTLTANPGELNLTGERAELNAQIDFTHTFQLLIELLPAEVTGNYATYSETLTVDGSEIPIRSWTYEETDQNLSGTLNVELAENSDRSVITKTADIDFTISVNGTSETLLSNGYLTRKDYSVSRQGIGPEDRVTFTALPQMAALLNTVPETNFVLYDPAKHNVSASDFEGVYDKEHNYTPPIVTSVTELDLYEIFDRILVTECGFIDWQTNIPNFPIAIIEFTAGESYMNGLAGIIGMFEPEFVPYQDGGLCLAIKDGTAGHPAGLPTPRDITVSKATNLGVASDISRIDGLLIHVAQERSTYDYTADRTDVTSTVDGATGSFPFPRYTTTITTTYRDFFRTEHPDRPIKTEVVREHRSTSDGVQTVHRSTEDFYYDSWGRLFRRTKAVEAVIPDPDGGFILGLIDISSETEEVTYAMHPFQPRHYFVWKREVNKAGLVFIDNDNQQLEVPYVSEAMNTYRAGNVHDNMTWDWRKISTFKEEITPKRNNFLRIQRTEIDWLANQKHEDRNELRQGEIGVNIFVQEQQRIYILPEGETAIIGTVDQVNMGELPFDTAIALGERTLDNRRELPDRVQFNLIGIDNTLQKGTAITAKGRDGANLGTYVIEARTLSGSQDGYFMTIQARQAG